MQVAIKHICCPLNDSLNTIKIGSRNISLKKNTIIYREDFIASNIYFLNKGSVKLIKNHKDGREFIINYVKKGCLCCIPAFNGGRYLMSAVTIEDSDITSVNIDMFREHVYSGFHVNGHAIIECLIERVRCLIEIISDLAFLNVSERLAKVLCHVSSDNEKIRLTHEELASMIGTVREVVSRTMADFKKRGSSLEI